MYDDDLAFRYAREDLHHESGLLPQLHRPLYGPAILHDEYGLPVIRLEYGACGHLEDIRFLPNYESCEHAVAGTEAPPLVRW